MGLADDFRDAWHRRDHAALLALFAPDARLHSPIITKPLERRQLDVLMRSLVDNLPPLEFTGEATLDDGRTLVMWRTTFPDGTELEATDVMTLGDDGRVREVTVFLRPLVGIAAFVKAVSPDLARARGASHARLIKGVNVAFAANAKATDRVAPRFMP